MKNTLISRRATILGSSAIGLSLATGLSSVAAQATPIATPSVDTFPVSIDHVYGTTTIETRPVRVVTIGWSTHDAVIALGTIPVAVSRNDWGGDSEGFLPWTREAIGDAELPATLVETDGIPFEDIIAVSPDVILAPYSGITDDDYATLSAIAPTVAFAETAWSATWQEVTLVTGRALGLEAEANRLIEDTNAYVQQRAAEYPVLTGKSFVYGNMGDGSTSFNIYTKTDSRPLFLESIGLVPSSYVESLEVDAANPFYAAISYERANEIEGDIVVFWFADQAEADTAMATAHVQAIPAFGRGSFAPIVGQAYVMATSAFSTLSIAYALEEFLPALATAAENVGA